MIYLLISLGLSNIVFIIMFLVNKSKVKVLKEDFSEFKNNHYIIVENHQNEIGLLLENPDDPYLSDHDYFITEEISDISNKYKLDVRKVRGKWEFCIIKTITSIGHHKVEVIYVGRNFDDYDSVVATGKEKLSEYIKAESKPKDGIVDLIHSVNESRDRFNRIRKHRK